MTFSSDDLNRLGKVIVDFSAGINTVSNHEVIQSYSEQPGFLTALLSILNQMIAMGFSETQLPVIFITFRTYLNRCFPDPASEEAAALRGALLSMACGNEPRVAASLPIIRECVSKITDFGLNLCPELLPTLHYALTSAPTAAARTAALNCLHAVAKRFRNLTDTDTSAVVELLALLRLTPAVCGCLGTDAATAAAALRVIFDFTYAEIPDAVLTAEGGAEGAQFTALCEYLHRVLMSFSAADLASVEKTDLTTRAARLLGMWHARHNEDVEALFGAANGAESGGMGRLTGALWNAYQLVRAAGAGAGAGYTKVRKLTIALLGTLHGVATSSAFAFNSIINDILPILFNDLSDLQSDLDDLMESPDSFVQAELTFNAGRSRSGDAPATTVRRAVQRLIHQLVRPYTEAVLGALSAVLAAPVDAGAAIRAYMAGRLDDWTSNTPAVVLRPGDANAAAEAGASLQSVLATFVMPTLFNASDDNALAVVDAVCFIREFSSALVKTNTPITDLLTSLLAATTATAPTPTTGYSAPHAAAAAAAATMLTSLRDDISRICPAAAFNPQSMLPLGYFDTVFAVSVDASTLANGVSAALAVCQSDWQHADPAVAAAADTTTLLAAFLQRAADAAAAGARLGHAAAAAAAAAAAPAVSAAFSALVSRLHMAALRPVPGAVTHTLGAAAADAVVALAFARGVVGAVVPVSADACSRSAHDLALSTEDYAALTGTLLPVLGETLGRYAVEVTAAPAVGALLQLLAVVVSLAPAGAAPLQPEVFSVVLDFALTNSNWREVDVTAGAACFLISVFNSPALAPALTDVHWVRALGTAMSFLGGKTFKSALPVLLTVISSIPEHLLAAPTPRGGERGATVVGDLASRAPEYSLGPALAFAGRFGASWLASRLPPKAAQAAQGDIWPAGGRLAGRLPLIASLATLRGLVSVIPCAPTPQQPFYVRALARATSVLLVDGAPSAILESSPGLYRATGWVLRLPGQQQPLQAEVAAAGAAAGAARELIRGLGASLPGPIQQGLTPFL